MCVVMSGKRLRPEADDVKLKPPRAKKTRTKEDVQETIKGIVEKIEQVGRYKISKNYPKF